MLSESDCPESWVRTAAREVVLSDAVRAGKGLRGLAAESRRPLSGAAPRCFPRTPHTAALTGGALRPGSVRGPDWAGHSHKSLVGFGDSWCAFGSALYFITFFPFAHVFCKGPAGEDSRDVHLPSLWGLGVVVRVWTLELEPLKVHLLALPLPRLVTLSQVFNMSVSLFSHFEKWGIM